jgi:hypothetical protein
MSGWERSRFIPWDKIPTRTGLEFNLEHSKERIYRQLQKEAIEKQQLKLQHNNSSNDTVRTSSTLDTTDSSLISTNNNDINNTTGNSKTGKNILPYSHMDLLRQIGFGATLGSITGSLFGFMDSMRAVQEHNTIKNASTSAKIKYLVQGTTRSGILFATFFSCYQSIKYGSRILLNCPGDVVEISIATPISLSLLYSQPLYRPATSYACMLIGMDCFSIYMRRTS